MSDPLQQPIDNLPDITDVPSPATSVISEAALQNEEENVRCAKFRQQELWAWKPVWSPRVVSIMYLIVAIIFIPIGITILIQSQRMFITPRFRYDNAQGCAPPTDNTTSEETRQCSIPIEVDRELEPPLYLYYGIVNFYQNARLYVTSRSDRQLRGENVTRSDADTCKPLIKGDGPNGVDYPCGLIANSFFNDTLELCADPDCSEPVQNVTRNNIAWDVDRNTRFKANENTSIPQNETDLIENEEFMNWMRLSAYRNWKKLYRVINTKLVPSTYYLKATSRFPVEPFNGQKFFFIAETSWFGGPNQILGISYIVVGGIALVFAILFIVQSRMLIEVELPEQTSIDLGDIVKKKIHRQDGLP